ncbi:glutathione S-transferase family protein [Xanthobacter oligotrophicus]|uniref:glutathione S-transferase family protein n=1 Tax=Xanthobacter oligotrophicus TaxID=2607286 RepID=UPI0011F32E7A|nr:glutathione S-transferase family protein [Xanthobacter oligotrophicus]MCG5237529.1 glutathione S-transferase family protein [Xanthobacter oligotrophicus]
MRIYGMNGSGNCWKAAQILSLTGHAFEWVETSSGAAGTRSPDFLALNPIGKVPVVVLDDGTALRESNAILLHFAEGTPWLPPPGLRRTRVHEWLFFEQYSHEPHIAVARYLKSWLRQAHLHEARLADCAIRGAAALDVMEQHLAGQPWLAGEGPTIADLALFAYTHRAEEADFDLTQWPAVLAWVERVAALPGISVIPPLDEILPRAS